MIKLTPEQAKNQEEFPEYEFQGYETYDVTGQVKVDFRDAKLESLLFPHRYWDVNVKTNGSLWIDFKHTRREDAGTMWYPTVGWKAVISSFSGGTVTVASWNLKTNKPHSFSVELREYGTPIEIRHPPIQRQRSELYLPIGFKGHISNWKILLTMPQFESGSALPAISDNKSEIFIGSFPLVGRPARKRGHFSLEM